jgi:hypothetical protein
MPKEEIRKMTGLFAAVFAHTGHISKEDAREISGLDAGAFEEVYQKASTIADEVMKSKGKKMGAFLTHYGKEVDEWLKHFEDPGYF